VPNESPGVQSGGIWSDCKWLYYECGGAIVSASVKEM
jgi:hypothetical protein